MTIFPASLVILAACASGGVHVDATSPRPDDVASVDGMMRAFYEVVNVAPDAPRQWARDRTLYAPWIRFIALGHYNEVWTHQQLVDETEPLVRAGFREREIHRTTRVDGNMVHVDSTYETLTGLVEPYTRSRGVNSVELYFDGKRWWIASVVWQSEMPDKPIPAELLPQDR